MASSSSILLMRMLSSSSFSVKFVTAMPWMFMVLFGGSMMLPVAVFWQFCSVSMFLSMFCHFWVILILVFVLSSSIMFVSESVLERDSSFCFGMFERLERLLSVCQVPSSIRLSMWSILDSGDMVSCLCCCCFMVWEFVV